MNVYPIYLNRLSEKESVIVGGNHEAERKAGELLACDAKVTIISSRISSVLQKFVDEKRLKWISRPYQSGDLEGAILVIVAEYSGNENEKVYEEAVNKGILVNVMDDSAHCNFTFGSIVKRGPLVLSISTSGTAPALAVRLRERLEKELGEEYERFLMFTKSLRPLMKKKYSTFDRRKEAWYQLIDSIVLDLLRQNKDEQAWQKASEILGHDIVHETIKNMSLN